MMDGIDAAVCICMYVCCNNTLNRKKKLMSAHAITFDLHRYKLSPFL